MLAHLRARCMSKQLLLFILLICVKCTTSSSFLSLSLVDRDRGRPSSERAFYPNMSRAWVRPSRIAYFFSFSAVKRAIMRLLPGVETSIHILRGWRSLSLVARKSRESRNEGALSPHFCWIVRVNTRTPKCSSSIGEERWQCLQLGNEVNWLLGISHLSFSSFPGRENEGRTNVM